MNRLSGIYASLIDEGRLAGTPAAVVRFTGCNLACTWCDGRHHTKCELDTTEVLQRVEKLKMRWVVLTGGEPTIQPHILEVARELKAAGHRTYLETNGLVVPDDLSVFDYIACSPKSAYAARYRATSFLTQADELRIVAVADTAALVSFCRQMRQKIAAHAHYLEPLEEKGRIHYGRAFRLLGKLNADMADDPPWALAVPVQKVLRLH